MEPRVLQGILGYIITLGEGNSLKRVSEQDTQRHSITAERTDAAKT